MYKIGNTVYPELSEALIRFLEDLSYNEYLSWLEDNDLVDTTETMFSFVEFAKENAEYLLNRMEEGETETVYGVTVECVNQ